jgi:protein involved in polysaccharide export with SLBB domain
LKLGGKTALEVEKDVKARLEKNMLPDAQVTVIVKEYNKQSVFVLGNVEKPGSFDIQFGKSLTFLQAVSKAGGFSSNADRDSMLLIRETKGKREAYKIAYSDIVEEGKVENDIKLADGDILIIREQKKVYVLGRVNAPGGFSFPAEGKLTLSKVISLARGFHNLAASNRTSVIRSMPDGTTRIYRVNVDSIFKGDISDIELAPGDIVFVPETLF